MVELRKYMSLPHEDVAFNDLNPPSDAPNQRIMRNLINSYVRLQQNIDDAQSALDQPLNYRQFAGGPIDDAIKATLTSFINSNYLRLEQLKTAADDCAYTASNSPSSTCDPSPISDLTIPIRPLPSCQAKGNCTLSTRVDGECVCEKCALVTDELTVPWSNTKYVSCDGFKADASATVNLNLTFGVVGTPDNVPGQVLINLKKEGSVFPLKNVCGTLQSPSATANGETFDVVADANGKITLGVEAALCTNGAGDSCNQNFNGACFLKPSTSGVPGVTIEVK